MSVGQNILAGNKGIVAPEFICGHNRILVGHSIIQPNCVVNGHGPQFSSDSTLGTAYGRVNHHDVGHLDNRLDYTFGEAVLIISNRFNKADVLVLFN